MTEKCSLTGKGRAHPVFSERVGIAAAEEVSDPACWLPPATGQAISARLWRNSGGEYRDEAHTLTIATDVELQNAAADLQQYVEARPTHIFPPDTAT